MSTRATIKFKDNYETFFIYRHCDGYPEVILPDILAAINKSKGRWSEPECGLLVSFFLGIHFKESERLPDYAITSSFHGDESYKYIVEYNADEKRWIVEVKDGYKCYLKARKVTPSLLRSAQQHARERRRVDVSLDYYSSMSCAINELMEGK